MQTKKQRINWLDSYRGIVIISIVFIHIITTFPVFEPVMKMFSIMRMPAFFFISGYLLSEKYVDFIFFFKHRFRQLIIPYFIFFILNIIFWQFTHLLLNNPYENTTNLVIGMFYGVPSSGLMSTAGPLWFVLALFLTEMYFMSIKVYILKDIHKLFTLTILAIIGFILSMYVEYRLPWNADIAFIGVLFYGLGNLTKKYNLLHAITINTLSIKIFFITLFLSISIWFSLNSVNDYARDIFDNIVFSFFGAMSGITALILISTFKIIENSQTLQYLGRNTYIILAFHNIAILILTQILFKGSPLHFDLPNNIFFQSILGILFLTIVILSMVPLIYTFNKVLPFILNK